MARTLTRTGRRYAISLAVVGLSLGLTGAMSLLFYRAIRIEMMITGFVCAVIIDRVVDRVTRHYRRRLNDANQMLEQRVAERTAELEHANTALREATHNESTLRDELMVKDRMATAGTLAAAVSHEIRSPLAVIRIAIDELAEQLDPATPKAQQELVTDISDATDRITVILRDLSSLAKPAEDPVAPTELAPVIESASRLASYRLGRSATLVCDSIEVPTVVGNAARLVQVVLNLLVNAARATRPDAPNTIRVGARVHDERVIVTIADTGTGMGPETRARLFEPFFTTGGTSGGTGLGLTICRSIVERMGGTITIESALGVGTTVAVSLQRA